MSKAIYVNSIFNAPMDNDIGARVERVRLAKEFGWTLDYVDSLDEFHKADIWGYLDGVARVQQHAQNKSKNKYKGKGGKRRR